MDTINNIHKILYNGINNLLFTLELDQSTYYKEVLEMESLYNKHMLKLYTNFTSNPSESNIDMFINTLVKYSIVDKWNKLSKIFKIEFIKLPNRSKKIDAGFSECTCGGLVILDDVNHTFTCESCGEIKQCVGLLNNRITKSNGKTMILKNNYKHKTYFTQIYKNIFALEVFKFDSESLQSVKDVFIKHCDNYKVAPKNVQSLWYRNTLKILKLNKWFPHINLLKKEITNICPPRLSQNEEAKLTMYYTIYTKIYDSIFKNTDTKKSYLRCEFIIDKILDQFLEDNDRKREILSNIILPQKNTLEDLDLKYERICKESNGILLYKPTVRLSF